MNGILSSSVGRKIAMALSGFFLLIFLLQHLVINSTSVISPAVFNQWSHYMGTNPFVQALLQPILIFGVVFHFVMGFALDIQNRKARGIKYTKNSPSANSTWISRNMILTGVVVLLFLGLHFYDFWVPEMTLKYIEGGGEDAMRYYPELVHKMADTWRVGLYILSFVFLSLHLLHGFSSAFQSVGLRNRYSPAINNIGKAYAILVPLGFVFIALFHYFNHTT